MEAKVKTPKAKFSSSFEPNLYEVDDGVEYRDDGLTVWVHVGHKTLAAITAVAIGTVYQFVRTITSLCGYHFLP